MRTAKALAYTPRVLVSTVLTMMVGAVLPDLAAWVLFVGGVLTGALVLSGFREPTAVRILFRARRLTAAERDVLAPTMMLLCQAGLGPPVVALSVHDRRSPVIAAGVGRECVLVSQGLVAAVRAGRLPPEQAAAVIAHAVGVVRAGATRSDAFLQFWTIPYQVLAGLAQGVACVFSGLPLVGQAWRLRFILGLIVAVQSWAQGSAAERAAGALAVAVVALSYLVPRWEAAWASTLRALGDEQVKQAGLAQPWSRFLRRCSTSPAMFERIHRLQAPAGLARPGLAAVTNPGRDLVVRPTWIG